MSCFDILAYSLRSILNVSTADLSIQHGFRTGTRRRVEANWEVKSRLERSRACRVVQRTSLEEECYKIERWKVGRKLEVGKRRAALPVIVIVTAGASARCFSKGRENTRQNGDNFLPVQRKYYFGPSLPLPFARSFLSSFFSFLPYLGTLPTLPIYLGPLYPLVLTQA